MTRWTAVLVASAALAAASPVRAQEAGPGPARVDVTIIPAGGTFFTESKDSVGPSFGNYGLGAGVTVNFNRYVGVEGEVSGGIGGTQDRVFAGETRYPRPT